MYKRISDAVKVHLSSLTQAYGVPAVYQERPCIMPSPNYKPTIKDLLYSLGMNNSNIFFPKTRNSSLTFQ
jgi:hypothetical protein